MPRGHLAHGGHVVPRVRVRLTGRGRPLASLHRRHVVAGVWIRLASGGRLLAALHGRHVVARRHSRGRRRLTHGRHVMPGVRVRLNAGWGWLAGLHRRHVVAGVKIVMAGPCRRSLPHRRHIVARVRIRRRLRPLGHGADRADGGARRASPGRISGRCAAPHTARRQRGGGLCSGRCRSVPGVALSKDRAGRGGDQQGNETDRSADHDAPPSKGRTVTTLNMPACMCISMWQWKAQSPGASAVRSKVTLPPGATLTVCLSG